MKGNEDVIRVLNEVLSAELTGVNQYFIHAMMCANWRYERLAQHSREESVEEMKHAQQVIERIQLVPVAGGSVVLGKSKEHPLYGWDNEFGRQENDVWDFSASRYLVSNQEYLGFVEDRGYEQEEYWTHEGWKWVGYSKARHPLFWIESPDG